MPSRQVFIDTNGWIALLNSSDALHGAAASIWSSLLKQGYSFVLTDWIVAEQEHGIHEAFTNDRHFSQAGWKSLLPLPG